MDGNRNVTYNIQAYEYKPYGRGVWVILNKKDISKEKLKSLFISNDYKSISIWDNENDTYLALNVDAEQANKIIKGL